MSDKVWKNRLYCGDNLRVLRCLPDDSVDLIYLDPPFNSDTNYHVSLGRFQTGGTRVVAFNDIWRWGTDGHQAYEELMADGPQKLAGLLQALRVLLGESDMMAYLSMMAIRLSEMHRILNLEGSIYLHCDQVASHYLKLVMDAIFGTRMFRNEIIWLRDPAGKGAKRISRQWPRNFDVILLYSKSDQNVFNQVYKELTDTQKKAYRYEDERGFYKAVQRGDYSDKSMERFRREGRIHVSSTGKEYVKYYRKDAKATLGSVWTDIYGFGTRTASKERLGYPTQKPEALLERIITASSEKGHLIMDPFCGSGTTLSVAERLGRRWIGVDNFRIAITLCKRRLESAFGQDVAPYEVMGESGVREILVGQE